MIHLVLCVLLRLGHPVVFVIHDTFQFPEWGLVISDSCK